MIKGAGRLYASATVGGKAGWLWKLGIPVYWDGLSQTLWTAGM